MMPTIYDIAEFLQNWRNKNPEIYDRRTMLELDEEFGDSVEAEATIYIQMLNDLIRGVYDTELQSLDHWNAVNEDIGGEQAIIEAKKILKLTQEWGPNHFCIMAGAADNDNRGNFLVWLAQGGKRWDKGEWFYLGATSDELKIESDGMFPSEYEYAKERAEQALEQPDYWESKGVLAFWLKFEFFETQEVSKVKCLNWIVWPELFVPLSTE